MYFHFNQRNSDRIVICEDCGSNAEIKLKRKSHRNGRTVCCNAKWWTEKTEE